MKLVTLEPGRRWEPETRVSWYASLVLTGLGIRT